MLENLLPASCVRQGAHAHAQQIKTFSWLHVSFLLEKFKWNQQMATVDHIWTEVNQVSVVVFEDLILFNFCSVFVSPSFQ